MIRKFQKLRWKKKHIDTNILIREQIKINMTQMNQQTDKFQIIILLIKQRCTCILLFANDL